MVCSRLKTCLNRWRTTLSLSLGALCGRPMNHPQPIEASSNAFPSQALAWSHARSLACHPHTSAATLPNANQPQLQPPSWLLASADSSLYRLNGRQTALSASRPVVMAIDPQNRSLPALFGDEIVILYEYASCYIEYYVRMIVLRRSVRTAGCAWCCGNWKREFFNPTEDIIKCIHYSWTLVTHVGNGMLRLIAELLAIDPTL